MSREGAPPARAPARASAPDETIRPGRAAGGAAGAAGRLAPSPTGALHLGNARSLLLAWLSARSQGGRLWLRVEDLLPGPPGAIASLLRDLDYLGLDWDPPPDIPGVVAIEELAPDLPRAAPFVLQSRRHAAYAAAARGLDARGLLYPCVCTRKDIERAVRAPHATTRGSAYPGTCRGRFASLSEALRHEAAAAARLGRPPVGAALRLRVPEAPIAFTDRLRGRVEVRLPEDSGDIVIRRKDGAWAYMLAVVVDDLAMGVTEVVRGDDLLECTAQQLLIRRELLASTPAATSSPPARPAPPAHLHVPLVYGDDGRRLAKRDRSLHVQALQRMGVPGAAVRRWLARSLDLPETGELAEMAAVFDWRRVPRGPVVFGARELAELRA